MMDKDSFRKLVTEILICAGFKRKGNHLINTDGEIFISINLQRSSYSNAYYINVGYFISSLDTNIAFPKVENCHFFTRMIQQGKKIGSDLFELDSIQESHVSDSIQHFMQQEFPSPLSVTGLQELIKRHPGFLYQASQRVKDSLGIADH